MARLDAEYFDQWYAAMPSSSEHERIQQGALGLPAHLLSTSLLPWDGIDDVAALLRLAPGDLLVDLACGRGGYGLEVAHRTGARLLGVDFSAVALDAARASAAHHFSGVAAEFRTGSLTDTGLPDDSAAAVMCVDAMQFAEPYEAGVAECARILAPGRPLVMTGWQAHDLDDAELPDRMRHDIVAVLMAAGFTEVVARDMSRWQQAEYRMWDDALASEVDDEAMRSMREEAQRLLAVRGRLRRLLVTGNAPAGRP